MAFTVSEWLSTEVVNNRQGPQLISVKFLQLSPVGRRGSAIVCCIVGQDASVVCD